MRTLSVQKHRSCFIRKLKLQSLQTALFKGVDIITLFKEIKNADEDDKSWRQQVIRLARLQQIKIKQRLIIARAFGQDKGFGLGILFVFYLHFQIIVRILVICYDDIQADAVARVVRINSFFCLNVVDVGNFYLQQLLQQMLADAFARHNLLEDEVTLNRQVGKFC